MENERKIKLQRVKNYDADDINEGGKRAKMSTENSINNAQNVGAASAAHSTKKQASTKSSVHAKVLEKSGEKAGLWTKILIGLTYIFGLSSIMFLLPSAWYFIGAAGVVFSFVILLLAKRNETKENSGKVFFVSLCGMLVSVLFWVLFLTTRRYGIGFLSSIFRALQIAGAVLSSLLILYYFVEFVSGGKLKIGWISSATDKVEKKLSHQTVTK